MIRIRAFEAKDLFSVAKLLDECTDRHCEEERVEYVIDITEKILSSGAYSPLLRQLTYVAVDGEDIVGVIRFVLNHESITEICPLFVHEDMQDLGVTELLLKKATDVSNMYKSRKVQQMTSKNS